MKEKLTIFESLLKKKVCFAVSVSLNSFINPKVKDNNKEYYFYSHVNNLPSLKRFGFHLNSDNPLLIERKMTDPQIKEFKANSERFTKVKHNKYGRIYELKGNSFKDYYLCNFVPIVSEN